MLKTVVLGFLILFSLVSLAEVTRLRIRPYNRVTEGGKISLLEVVDTTNLQPAEEKKLSRVILGDAPNLGEQRIFTNKAIAETMRQSLNEKIENLKIPHEVIVENRGYELSQETVKNELMTRWQLLCADCQLKINSLQLPTMPPTAATVPWFINNDQKLPRGHFAQKLVFTKPDGHTNIYWINGQLEILKKVPVLTRSTPINTRFTDEDFKMEWRDVTYATDTAPTAKEIIGQQAKYTMNANDIIWRGSLLREKAVQRGEVVRVLVAGSSWQISTQAVTEQDGFIGDLVNLRNSQTNKVITGKVVGEGEVEIR